MAYEYGEEDEAVIGSGSSSNAREDDGERDEHDNPATNVGA